jgi:hypothetical protein
MYQAPYSVKHLCMSELHWFCANWKLLCCNGTLSFGMLQPLDQMFIVDV